MGASLAQVIRQALSAAKTVDSPLLNRLGLQAARAIAAHTYYRMRSFQVEPDVRAWVEQVWQDGLVLVPGFLSTDDLVAAQNEVRTFWKRPQGQLTRHEHGATIVEHCQVSDELLSEMPACRRFFRDPRLRGVLSGAEKRPLQSEDPDWIVERVTSGGLDANDPETKLHVDTFHHTHKAWLFLEDVHDDSGPLCYVPRSNHLTLPRLRSVYRESHTANRRSPRIGSEEFAASGLSERQLTCAANTLAVADVGGFHRRVMGTAGQQRFGLLVSVRHNPFMSPAMVAWTRRLVSRLRG